MNQWVPKSGSDPNEVRGGFDVGSREGFMENLIIMKKLKFVSKLKQNDRENIIIESVFVQLQLEQLHFK